MKLVSAKQAETRLINAAANKKLRSISLCTFKKDRSVSLQREDGGWQLDEDGFVHASTALPSAAAGKRMVKDAFKREFPRSNKIYLSEVYE